MGDMAEYYDERVEEAEWQLQDSIAYMMERETDESLIASLKESMAHSEYEANDFTGLVEKIIKQGAPLSRKQRYALCRHYVEQCDF